MKEIFESIFGAYKSRYQNKFFGTFLMMYMLLNWERVVAVFYLSNVTYEQFIERITVPSSLLWILLLKAFFLSVIYLVASPWISLAVLKVQSGAVRRYRIQKISDEIEVLNKKKSLEEVKKEVISLEKDNADAVSTVFVPDPNKTIFNNLRQFLPEKSLIGVYDNIESNRYLHEDIGLLRNFYNESMLLENEFDNIELKEYASEASARIKLLYEGLAQIKKLENKIDPTSANSLKMIGREIMKNKSETLSVYRDFLRVGFDLD